EVRVPRSPGVRTWRVVAEAGEVDGHEGDDVTLADTAADDEPRLARLMEGQSGGPCSGRSLSSALSSTTSSPAQIRSPAGAGGRNLPTSAVEEPPARFDRDQGCRG